VDKNDYHSGTARLTSSGAKELLRSPAHYMLKFGPRAKRKKPTSAMAFGTALHLLVLEGEAVFKNSIAVDPGINRRTKAGKQEWEEFIMRHEHVRDGMFFKLSDIDQLYFLRDAVFKHETAGHLLSEGKPEVYMEWDDGETGAPCKMLADWVCGDMIVDLKSCVDASPPGFGRATYTFKYHLSAEFYKSGFSALNNGVVPEWYWIAAEKETCQIAVYTMDEAAIRLGAAAARSAINTYAECQKTGHWGSYSSVAQELVSPAWAR